MLAGRAETVATEILLREGADMNMKSSEKVVCGIIAVLLGLLFLSLQGDVVSVAVTLLGAALVVWGVLDLFDRKIETALLKIAGGAAAILFGWLIVSAVLYVLAVALMIFGVWLLYVRIRESKGCVPVGEVILHCALPVACMLTAFFLFFNDGGAAAWAFILSGICMVIVGGLFLWEAFHEK